MVKSLYVRVVLTFIASVILSLILAFFLATLLYKNQLTTRMQEELITSGKQIIRSYEKSSSNSIEGFINEIGVLPNYQIQIYNNRAEPVSPSEGNDLKFDLKREQLESVLNGGVYRGTLKANKHKGPDNLVVGLPFQVQKAPYALFISPKNTDILNLFALFLRTVLIIVLILGSLFIMISARYIVKPLHQLTEATRRLAKGDFSIHVQSKRKDEIGILTASINDMAKELGMLDQMRQDFVANVSHEIQSPLTSITGFTKALKNKKMDEAKQNHYLTIIEVESERLSRLSANLLHLSSLQHDQQPFHPRYYRLDEQLRAIVISCEPQWSLKKQIIDLHMEEVTIYADEDQLNQVWLNLIHNSIKFTPDEGTLRIELEQKYGQVIVSVMDSGIGVAEEEMDYIFKPFYKVDKAREHSANSGSGLGLSIVKRIVDIHHGDIQVSSVLGEGTVIKVDLPLVYE
jgi:signal transduction histidine kinase